jgi:hypothetical protein
MYFLFYCSLIPNWMEHPKVKVNGDPGVDGKIIFREIFKE